MRETIWVRRMTNARHFGHASVWITQQLLHPKSNMINMEAVVVMACYGYIMLYQQSSSSPLVEKNGWWLVHAEFSSRFTAATEVVGVVTMFIFTTLGAWLILCSSEMCGDFRAGKLRSSYIHIVLYSSYACIMGFSCSLVYSFLAQICM